MKTRTEEIKKELPQLRKRSQLQPETINEEQRTIDVIVSTGAEGRRGGFFTAPYMESLSLKADHVRMDRLNNGAPLLDSHRGFSTRDQLGKVEKAWIEKNKLIATVRFSKKESVKDIWEDVRDGIITHISTGYQVNRFKDITGPDDKIKRLRAIDWEPMEVSLVPMGFDDGATVRSNEDQQLFPVIIERDIMEEKEKDGAKTPTAPTDNKPTLTAEEKRAIEHQAIEAERARIADINHAVRAAGLDASFADDLVKKGVTADEARKAVIDKWSQDGEKTPQQRNMQTFQVIEDETEKRIANAENYFMNRINRRKYELEGGREFRGMTLLDMSRRILEWNDVNHKNMDKNKIAIRALSTSDFPLLLENIATKTLRDGYNYTPQSFLPYVRRETAPDFKQISRTQLGEAPQFKKVVEGGEIVYGSMAEGAEKYQLATYAAGVMFTRECIINDDLSAFNRAVMAFGQQAAQLESDLFWQVITTNPNMADGNALFSAAHGNLAGAGAAISDTTLDAAFVAMGTQKGLDGKTNLNIPPMDLVVPNALRGTALKFVAQNLIPAEMRQKATQPSEVNIYHDMGVTVESRLHTASTTEWYVFTRVEMFGDMIEMLTLADADGPEIVTTDEGGVKGVKVEAVYDLASKAIDWRGFYKNPGA